MKALTIHQPWASLIACETKRFETRSWKTSYRGPIAIHAGNKPILLSPWLQKQISIGSKFSVVKALNLCGIDSLNSLPLGCIVATAELIECWQVKNLHRFLGDSDLQIVAANGSYKSWAENCVYEMSFGDFTPGRYAWEFRNVKLLDTPIPARGQQGLWNWEEGGAE